MLLHIEHTTEYTYPEPAIESFCELRLRPRDSLRQTVSHHYTRVQPAVHVDDFTDYFGNFVETIAVPFRHRLLSVTSLCDVETEPYKDALSQLDLTVMEARQLYGPRLRELYDFLQPSRYIPFSQDLHEMARRLLPPRAGFVRALKDLNSYIFEQFKYRPGSTDVTTTVPEFLQTREGVCQDFAHLMISLCRLAGIPARYISGYIETEPVRTRPDSEAEGPLIGATASHAWVEIFAPNHFWVGLDPTNNSLEGERHIQIGVGRDYQDVPPLKGVYKGPNRQNLSVAVRVTRNGLSPVLGRSKPAST